jgi:hypothetical protein
VENAMSRESIPPSITRLFDRHQAVLALLNGWFYIILFAGLGATYAIHNLQDAENVYQAQMQVMAAQPNEGAANSQLGAVAALAQIATPLPQTGTQFSFYVDSLTSRDVADVLAKNPRVMHTIFADQWDEATQTWHPPPETRWQRYRREIKQFVGLPVQPWHAPTGEELLYFLTGNVQVQGDPRKPYLTKIALYYPDRDFAVYFLNLLNQTADSILRQKEIQRTTQNIAFLGKTLGTITIAEHRAAIAQVLSAEEKRLMSARNDSPFAAEFFERPWAATFPSFPVPMQSIMWGAITGAIIGYLLAFIHWHIRPHLGGLRLFRRPRRVVSTG